LLRNDQKVICKVLQIEQKTVCKVLQIEQKTVCKSLQIEQKTVCKSLQNGAAGCLQNFADCKVLQARISRGFPAAGILRGRGIAGNRGVKPLIFKTFISRGGYFPRRASAGNENVKNQQLGFPATGVYIPFGYI
jgi:hypothetical protein